MDEDERRSTPPQFLDTNYYPIVVVLPNNPLANSVLVKRTDGTIIGTQKLGPIALADLINAIPKNAFWFDADGVRNLLLHEATKEQNLVSADKNGEAITVLDAIYIGIELGTRNFDSNNSVHLSKSEILDKVSDMIKSIRGK